MAGFQRKGTVSKSSGPTHIDSYALKGVPIRYKPPLYVPEINHLPITGQVSMPLEDLFTYNYSTENKVLEQARTRARSVASEASLERRKFKELQDRQASESNKTTQQAKPLPAFLSSDTILTPIPVANNTSNTSQSSSDSSRKSNQTGLASIADSGGGAQAESKDNSNVIKSLGQMSIREFEGDNLDPFEITSLQAINDLEVLQSVLQPTVVNPTMPATSSPSPIIAHPSSSQSGDASLQTSSSAIVQSSASAVTIATQQSSSPTPLQRSASKPTTPPKPAVRKVSEPTAAVPQTSTTSVPARSDSTPIPTQQLTPPQDLFSTSSPAVVFTNPFGSQTPITTVSPYPVLSQTSSTSSTVTNPFVVASGTPVFVASSPTTAPVQAEAAGPSVGTLIEIGNSAPGSTEQLPTPPVPAVRRSPPIQSGQAPPCYPTTTAAQPQGIPPSQSSPVPKPRTHLPSQARPLSAGERTFANGPPTQPGAAVAVQPRPLPVGPKPSVSVAPVPHSTGVPTALQPASVSPQIHPRFGLGVPVLPPIPTASTAAPVTSSPASHTTSSTSAAGSRPPPYKPQPSPPTQRVTPPPPYQPYDQQQPQQRGGGAQSSPAVAPRQYKLPDLQSSLSSDQKTEVNSIAGMGFPPQRVARAVLKYDSDRSKVLDFLFLVGNLEELRFNGDSAETALLTCDEDIDKAKEYLSKVDQFKGMGFSEKAIHESYNKAKGDWDKVLDLLITGAR